MLRIAALLATASLSLAGWAAEEGALLAQREPSTESVDRPSASEPKLQPYLPEKPADVFKLPPLHLEPSLQEFESSFGLEIRSFVFEGNTVFSDAELQVMAAPFAGRIVSASELEELRQKLTRAYVERGYINSGAVIPQGALKDGELRFQIIEGRFEDIRLKGMERLHDGYVRGRLARGVLPLNVNVLQENFRLLLSDPLFTKMDARLLPGSEPGRAILDLDVTRARPYQLTIFANNYRPPSIGEGAAGLSASVRNLSGLGDTLDATWQSSTKTGGGARYAIGWNLPLNTRGTALQMRFDRGRSSVIEEPLNLVDIKSTLDSREVGISHALIEDLQHKLSLGLTYAVRENRTTLLGEPFSFIPGESSGVTKLSAWRFWQDYVRRQEQQVYALRSTFSAGHDNIEQIADSTSARPARNFLVWLGQGQYSRRVLDAGAQILVRADVQRAHDPLLPLERIAVGGVNTVRGYRENQMVRDNGYRVSVEYQHPLVGSVDARQFLTLSPFIDHGAAWNIGETRDRIRSTGLAVHWRWQRITADVVAAKRLVTVPTPGRSTLQDHGIHIELRYDVF